MWYLNINMAGLRQVLVSALFFIVVMFLTEHVTSDELKKSYHLRKKKVSWSEARILCEREKMSLATVRNTEDQSLLQTVLENNRGIFETFWIAATNIGCDNNQFCWFGNPGTPVNYTNWALFSGITFNDDKCVKVGTRKAMWFDITCTWKLFYICESYT